MPRCAPFRSAGFVPPCTTEASLDTHSSLPTAKNGCRIAPTRLTTVGHCSKRPTSSMPSFSKTDVPIFVSCPPNGNAHEQTGAVIGNMDEYFDLVQRTGQLHLRVEMLIGTLRRRRIGTF